LLLLGQKILRHIYTSSFCMCFPYCVAIFYYLPWLCKTKVSYKKLQLNVVNAFRNRMCKLSLSLKYFFVKCVSWPLFWRSIYLSQGHSHSSRCILLNRPNDKRIESIWEDNKSQKVDPIVLSFLYKQRQQIISTPLYYSFSTDRMSLLPSYLYQILLYLQFLLKTFFNLNLFLFSINALKI